MPRGAGQAGALTLAAVLSGVAVAYAPGILAVPAGLGLVFVLPGLPLVRLLFRRRVLSGAERFALVPALSVATVIIGGIVLYALGARLTRGSWTALIVGVTVLAAALVYLQRVRVARSGWTNQDTAEFGTVLSAGTEQVPLSRAALRLGPLILAAILLAGSGYVALRAAQHSATPFTTLSMVPGDKPAPVALGTARRDVLIEVTSAERADTSYTVRLSGQGGFSQTLSVQLPPGGYWSQTVQVPFPGRVTVDLFRGADTAAPYRTVFLAGDK
jgi:hypothetical protein